MRFFVATVICLIIFLYPTNGYGQAFNVEKVAELPADISAQRNARYDYNGDKCALLKVQCVLSDMEFIGSVIDSVSYLSGEYWVYLVDGTKKMTCKHPRVQPLKIDFMEYLQSPLEGGHTYELSLGIPETLYAFALNVDRVSVDLAKMDVDSLYVMAKRLFDAKQYAQSLPYVKAGIEREDAQAQNLYGVMLQHGLGVQKDSISALSYYQKAANKGLPKAQTNLGLVYAGQKRYAEACEWYRLAAEQGYGFAQGLLGSCYMQGLGVPQNYTEALKWLVPAAEQDIDGAQAALGLCYFTGNGVEKDMAKAEYWFKKAAEKGNAQAVKALTLFEMYQNLDKQSK